MPSWTAISLSAVCQLFLISSSNFFSYKPPVAGTGHPIHCLSQKLAFSRCVTLTFFGPVTHSAHTNTVTTMNNLQSAVNSIGQTPLVVKNATTGSYLKGINNSQCRLPLSHTTATQPVPTEVTEQML
jgi:hypothetical protein